ncbi:MAG: anthranilate phosphoribosyltransferase [Acidimicrobiia bacterium]
MSADATLWPDVIGALMRGESAPSESIDRVMAKLLEGEATDAQIAGFAVALRAKGETSEELAVMVRAMLRHAQRVQVDAPEALIDTCGTGGDRAGTINVSTLAALIAAGAGARVAKHGNRAASSLCGSADVLETLGVIIDLGPAGVARCIEETGIGFCFAPTFHPGLRFAAPTRRELGVRTTFNFLGPLANPAGVRHQAMGVSDPSMAERMIGTLRELGAEHALVFYGHDGLDELTLTTTSTAFELRGGAITTFEVDPAALGLRVVDLGDLAGGDAATNARVVREVLAGAPGPAREVALLNAAAALIVADLAADLPEGIERGAAAIDSGAAARVLESFVHVSTDARTREGS